MLDKAMYGTRDAPVEWQAELERTMVQLGFVAVQSTPCLYYHAKSGVRVVGHVDDLMCVGSKTSLVKFLDDLKKKYQLTAKILGPGKDEVRSGTFLGRRIGWEAGGLTWTGDERMARSALEEWEMTESREVETPGVAEEVTAIGLEDAALMDPEQAAKYRRTAAKLNYASLDNPTIAFAAKEASRTMSAPRMGDDVKIKRILRYLQRTATATYLFEWQDAPAHLDGYTDSDWAGCKRTRRSTSGGVVLHGSHLIHHHSIAPRIPPDQLGTR